MWKAWAIQQTTEATVASFGWFSENGETEQDLNNKKKNYIFLERGG